MQDSICICLISQSFAEILITQNKSSIVEKKLITGRWLAEIFIF